MTTLYCNNTTKNGYFKTLFFKSHRIMKCHNAETIQNGFWTRRQQIKKMPMLHLFAVYVTLKTISVFFLNENSFVATNIVTNGFFGLSCQFPHYYFSVQRNLVGKWVVGKPSKQVITLNWEVIMRKLTQEIQEAVLLNLLYQNRYIRIQRIEDIFLKL